MVTKLAFTISFTAGSLSFFDEIYTGTSKYITQKLQRKCIYYMLVVYLKEWFSLPCKWLNSEWIFMKLDTKKDHCVDVFIGVRFSFCVCLLF
jgi:hypothetical protein